MDFGRISGGVFCREAPRSHSARLSARGPHQRRIPRIGFIYVGSRDDYGYNQAHAQGAAALKKMPGLKV